MGFCLSKSYFNGLKNTVPMVIASFPKFSYRYGSCSWGVVLLWNRCITYFYYKLQGGESQVSIFFMGDYFFHQKYNINLNMVLMCNFKFLIRKINHFSFWKIFYSQLIFEITTNTFMQFNLLNYTGSGNYCITFLWIGGFDEHFFHEIILWFYDSVCSLVYV
jgi:hypothetical protein